MKVKGYRVVLSEPNSAIIQFCIEVADLIQNIQLSETGDITIIRGGKVLGIFAKGTWKAVLPIIDEDDSDKSASESSEAT